MKKFILALSLLSFSLTSLSISALTLVGSDEEKGHAIAIETERLDLGFKDYTVTAEMLLMQQGKLLSERSFDSKVLEIVGDGDHSVNIFNSPRDVAGTAILIHSHGTRPDDQWIYLPAVKRVKRISTRSKSGPFVGSEFAYEDISSWVQEKYTYKLMAEEKIDTNDCYKVENTPAYSDSGYSKLYEWVDKKIFRPRKIEYYDRKGDLLKTLIFEGYKQYQNAYWRPSKMIMTNHQTGRSTEINWGNYQYGTGLTAADISKSKLRNIR